MLPAAQPLLRKLSFFRTHTLPQWRKLIRGDRLVSLWLAATIYALFLVWVALSGRLLAMLYTGSWHGGSPARPRGAGLLERVKQWTLRR